jgi:hypothetical protein
LTHWVNLEGRVKMIVRSIRMAAALAVLGAALFTGGTALARSAGQGFSDPGGDANGGPDIRGIAISDTGGILTVKFTVTNMKVVADSGVKVAEFWMALDVDKDGKSDYYLDVFGDPTGVSWDIENGKEKMVKQTPTMSFFSSGNLYTFKLSSTDIGGATDFGFYVRSSMKDATDKWVDADDAPDGGRLSYSLTSVKPVIGPPNTSQAAPVAGKKFVMTFPVTRSDSGARLTSGTLTSALTLGGVALKPVTEFKNGTAMLRFTVPATAKGKLVAVRVAIDFAGRSATNSTSFRVG